MSRFIVSRRKMIVVVAGAAATVLCLARLRADPAADQWAAATRTLTQKGLTKLKPVSGVVAWVLEEDANVHQKLEALTKAEKAERDAAKKTHGDSITTAKDREVLSKAEKHYLEIKPYADKPETIPPQIARKFRNQQAMIQALNDDLNSTVETIKRLRPKLSGPFVGDMPPSLKSDITDWMNARNELIVAYLAAEPVFNELNKKYKKLGEDADVAAALKVLGKKNRIGSKDFEQDQTAMAAAEKVVLSGEIPFYRNGLFDSIGGLLNETTPVVVRIQTMNNEAGNWAPASELAKAGITVDAAAPGVTLNFTGNGKRTIQCRQVIVPKLRFGKFMLENLKFLALPDDAKDLGFQISSKELLGFDMTPDVEKWLFKLVKKEVPKPENDTPETTDPGKSKSEAADPGKDGVNNDKSDKTDKIDTPNADRPDKSGKPADDKDAKR